MWYDINVFNENGDLVGICLEQRVEPILRLFGKNYAFAPNHPWTHTTDDGLQSIAYVPVTTPVLAVVNL